MLIKSGRISSNRQGMSSKKRIPKTKPWDVKQQIRISIGKRMISNQIRKSHDIEYNPLDITQNKMISNIIRRMSIKHKNASYPPLLRFSFCIFLFYSSRDFMQKQFRRDVNQNRWDVKQRTRIPIRTRRMLIKTGRISRNSQGMSSKKRIPK